MSTPEQDLLSKLSPGAPPAPAPPMEGPKPDPSTPVTLRNLFLHPDAHPVVIGFALAKAFGEDWQDWAADTLYAEIQKTFGTQLSAAARAKIRAVQTCHVTDLPWKKWQVFEKVVMALNGVIPTFYHLQIPTLEQLHVAVDMMNGIREEQWSDEVKLYIAGAVLYDDVFFVIEPLGFAQVEISQPHYVCKDCGTQESALFHDGYCSNCTDRLHPDQGLSLAPKQELVNEGKGRNVDLVVKYDPEPIRRRWVEVKTATPDVLDLTKEEDVQCLKLMAARDAMTKWRERLAEQLTTLKSWLGAE